MIVVIATMHSRPGREKEALDLLKGLVAPTHKESGCIQYDLHVADDDPGAFAFYERWKSREDLDAHFKTPHLAAALSRIPDLMTAEPEIRIFQLVDQSR